MSIGDEALQAVIRVGAGRGFVLQNHHQWPHISWRTLMGNVVVTAAHCLPQLPPANQAIARAQAIDRQQRDG